MAINVGKTMLFLRYERFLANGRDNNKPLLPRNDRCRQA